MKSLTPRKKIALITLLLAVIAIVCFFLWLQSGNTGEIRQASSDSQKTGVSGTKFLDGQFMSFEYPGTYFSRQLQNNNVDLELYQLDASTAYTKKLVAGVTRLPDGTLKSNSAYLLRKNRPDLYRLRTDVSGENVEVWANFENTEQTVFITKNDQAAVLAFTQNGGDVDALTSEVDTILKSFKWK